MDTANDEYSDAVLRHQIGVRRFSAGLNNRIADLMEANDRDLIKRLRIELSKFKGKEIDFNSRKWRDLIASITLDRRSELLEVENSIVPELIAFAALEASREVKILTKSVPIEFSFNVVPYAQLKAIVTEKPFYGHKMKEWFGALSDSDRNRITRSIQLGMVQGESLNAIAGRVSGTRAKNFIDGDMSITRRDARSLVTTAVSHVSNVARNDVFEENSDVVTARILTATLDGITSAICRARDGNGAPTKGNKLPEGINPIEPITATLPFHPNERSVWTGYIDGLKIVGSRPFVITKNKKKVDFKKIAKDQGKTLKQVRAEWVKKNVGQVSSRVKYNEFLKRQAPEFQDDVLGKTKGILFRKGKLKVNEYVDRVGNELTLKQLAYTKPEEFIRSGLDPEDFI